MDAGLCGFGIIVLLWMIWWLYSSEVMSNPCPFGFAGFALRNMWGEGKRLKKLGKNCKVKGFDTVSVTLAAKILNSEVQFYSLS